MTIKMGLDNHSTCNRILFTGTKDNIAHLIGSPHFELAQTVIALTRSKFRILKKKLPHDDPRQRRSDIGLATRHLSWQPAVGLEAGLKKTVAYFRAGNSGKA